MIDFEQFGWRFAGATSWAIQDISLHLARGEFVAVVGPSGSGKTTLALAMCGLLIGRQDGEARGSVRVAGQDVAAAPLHQTAQTIGLVQQNPETHFATLTVSDEIAFGMENRCLARAEIHQASAKAMELVSITHLRDRSLATLSGGEKQRVAVASILAGKPEAMIFDEPTASLDPEASRDLFHSLADLCTGAGLTVVIIEHKLAQLMPLKPRLICLEAGRIVERDRIGEFLDPAAPTTPTEQSESRSAEMRRKRGEHGEEEDKKNSAVSAISAVNSPQSSVLSPQCAMRNPQSAIVNPQSPIHNSQSAARAMPSTAPHPIIEMADITVRLGGCTILDGVSLQVRPGEIVAVLGPNGGGKSTLLRCLLGLIQPTRGSIRTCGVAVSRMTVSRLARDVGFVFQNADHQLVADTVRREALFAAHNFKMSEASAEQTVQPLLERAGLSERLEDHPYRLSWGQKRRLNLISAILHGPRLLLLDEPFAGQDWENVAFLLDALADVLKVRADTAVAPSSGQCGACLIVTHDPRVVSRSCTRLLFISEGRVTLDAPVPAAFERLVEMGHEAYVPVERSELKAETRKAESRNQES